MHNPSAVTPRCTILRRNGDFCDLASIEDGPFPVCGRHALELHRHLSELTEIELANLTPKNRNRVPQTRIERRTQNEALRLLQGFDSLVYAVRFPATKIIKIGCTSNLAQRLNSFRKDGGELVGFMPGDYELEQEIHATLREHRHHGREWYHAVPAVMAIVNEMRDGFDLPHLAA